jgi:hypothetical protein
MKFSDLDLGKIYQDGPFRFHYPAAVYYNIQDEGIIIDEHLFSVDTISYLPILKSINITLGVLYKNNWDNIHQLREADIRTLRMQIKGIFEAEDIQWN